MTADSKPPKRYRATPAEWKYMRSLLLVEPCAICGGYAPGRYGCWGTTEHPHEHAFMKPIHELVRSLA